MKALNAEDEAVIRSGMVKHVLWNSLGVNEIKAAGSTNEALGICKDYSSDIEIIFVTGYDNKEYLKAAIEHSKAVDAEKEDALFCRSAA